MLLRELIIYDDFYWLKPLKINVNYISRPSFLIYLINSCFIVNLKVK